MSNKPRKENKEESENKYNTGLFSSLKAAVLRGGISTQYLYSAHCTLYSKTNYTNQLRIIAVTTTTFKTSAPLCFVIVTTSLNSSCLSPTTNSDIFSGWQKTTKFSLVIPTAPYTMYLSCKIKRYVAAYNDNLLIPYALAPTYTNQITTANTQLCTLARRHNQNTAENLNNVRQLKTLFYSANSSPLFVQNIHNSHSYYPVFKHLLTLLSKNTQYFVNGSQCTL